jgi:guanosine-3',5'-bis(diphosphate) 3'-pyrophosphohydrolase
MTARGDLLNRAIVLATNAHAGQKDKSGSPYILHPLTVMGLLETDDEELQCIAMLHDAIEDTPVTFQDLREQEFTDRIIDAVRALTKMTGQTYQEYQAAVFANRDAMLVKLADLTHNTDVRRLKGISQKDIDRMTRYHMFFYEIQKRLNQKTEI